MEYHGMIEARDTAEQLSPLVEGRVALCGPRAR